MYFFKVSYPLLSFAYFYFMKRSWILLILAYSGFFVTSPVLGQVTPDTLKTQIKAIPIPDITAE